MDETIERSLENESLEENFCILEVLQIRAGAEPEGYNLLYSFSLKTSRYSEASRFKVGPSSRFSNLEISEMFFKQNFRKVFDLT